MFNKIKNLSPEQLIAAAVAGATVIWSVGYFIRSIK